MDLVDRMRSKITRRLAQQRDGAEIDRFLRDNPAIRATIEMVQRERLTFLDQQALVGLAATVQNLDLGERRGAIIEAGTALGGSSVVIAAAKARDRQFICYDTFGMIPPPSDFDGEDVHDRYAVIAAGESEGFDGEVYYGYRDDLIGEISASMTRAGFPPSDNEVTFLQGIYQDTMDIDFPVALAHVDCDWYESVMTCLERITPWLTPGGRFIIDDYDAWSGARTAVDEFMSDSANLFRAERRFGRIHILKTDLFDPSDPYGPMR